MQMKKESALVAFRKAVAASTMKNTMLDYATRAAERAFME